MQRRTAASQENETGRDARTSLVRSETALTPTRWQRLYRWWQGFLRKLPRRLVQLAGSVAMFGGILAPFIGYPLGFGLFFVGRHYLLRPTDQSRPWWADFVLSLVDRWKPPPTL
jgi:hypothetical protein